MFLNASRRMLSSTAPYMVTHTGMFLICFDVADLLTNSKVLLQEVTFY